MVYSDVVNQNLILPKKQKYTLRDCKTLQINSLFQSGGTMSNNTARFIVQCSAVYHGAEYSKAVSNYENNII